MCKFLGFLDREVTLFLSGVTGNIKSQNGVMEAEKLGIPSVGQANYNVKIR